MNCQNCQQIEVRQLASSGIQHPSRAVRKSKMAQSEEVKTLQKFASVKSSSGPTIQTIALSKRRHILMISNGSEFLYLVVEDNVAHTFRFTKPVISSMFQEFNGKRQIFAATNDGNIFAVMVPENLANSKRSRKKCNVISEDSRKRKNDGDGDIFTELLAGCSTSAEALHEKPKQSHHVSNSMTVVDVGSAVLFEPGLRTFLPIGDRVISCRVSNEAYVLSMFHQIAPATGLDTVAYSALPALKITVGLSSLVLSLQESQKSCFRNDTPHFLCVQPRNSVSYLPSCTAIERSLFNKLFNSDASLLDSPVIIFGGQDGQVHFWPINSFAFNNMASKNLGAKQSVSPQLLYHLEQGVMAIYVANLPFQEVSSDTGHAPVTRGPGSNDKNRNEPCSGYCNAVVFVGEYDKVVIASERQSFADKGRNCLVAFSEHTILGPVVCSCLNSNGDTLIHSTGKEIFFTKLSLNGENSVIASLSASSPAVLTAVSFQLPNVNAVCFFSKKKKTGEASNRDKVYAFTVNGKLVCFDLPDFQDGGSCIDSDFTAQMAGEKVKSYLSEIETQSTELSKVSAAIQSEGDVLKELNAVIHIACELSECTVTSESLGRDQDVVPLICTFTPIFANLIGSGYHSVTLHCKVVNQGSLPLSSRWSLMIRIHGKEPWLNETNGECSTLGQSVPLTSLRPGSSFEVDIPLGKSLSSSFHVVAEADLYCDLNAMLADLTADSDSGLKKAREDIVIPVTRQVLDILHFVMPNQIGFQVHGPSVAPGTKEQLLLSLSKLNSENQVTGCAVDLSDDRGTNVNQESTYHGSYSATFYLSQDAVSFMMNAIQKRNLEQKIPQVTTQQATVFHFILRDSSISNHPIDAECSCMDLLTVNGSRASIRVKLVSESTMEVLLLCPSVHLLCRLHEAVLTRLKPVIARETRNCEVRAYELQKALEKLQILQEKLISFEDPILMGRDRVHGSEIKVKLGTLYEDLRKIVLVI